MKNLVPLPEIESDMSIPYLLEGFSHWQAWFHGGNLCRYIRESPPHKDRFLSYCWVGDPHLHWAPQIMWAALTAIEFDYFLLHYYFAGAGVPVQGLTHKYCAQLLSCTPPFLEGFGATQGKLTMEEGERRKVPLKEEEGKPEVIMGIG